MYVLYWIGSLLLIVGLMLFVIALYNIHTGFSESLDREAAKFISFCIIIGLSIIVATKLAAVLL